MLYRLTSTTWRAGLFMGTAFGLSFGLFTGVREHSLAEGLATGVIGGAFFGTFMALVVARRQLHALVGVEAPDRAEVMRIVRKGLAVHDARLAPAVVAYAGTLRQQSERASVPLWPAGWT